MTGAKDGFPHAKEATRIVLAAHGGVFARVAPAAAAPVDVGAFAKAQQQPKSGVSPLAARLKR